MTNSIRRISSELIINSITKNTYVQNGKANIKGQKSKFKTKERIYDYGSSPVRSKKVDIKDVF